MTLWRTALLGSLGVVGTALTSPHRFVVSRHRLALGGLEAPVRVAHLSDLHYGAVHGPRALGAWVEAAERLEPDLVLVTGDFVEGKLPPADLGCLGPGLSGLRAPLGVFGVLGNHDYGGPGRDVGPLVRALEAAGVTVLVNRGLSLRPDLYLAGVDDLWWGRPDLAAALRDAPERGARLLMSHNPDLLPRVPPEVGLTFSGHTHGGQIVLPLIGALHTGSSYGGRFRAGLVHGPALGFVSRGLGTTSLPIRLGCPPEVALLELRPA